MATTTITAYIGLGANLGDACATLRMAFDDIRRIPRTSRHMLSPLYRTAPIDSHGPDYINAVASVDTTLGAAQLLDAMQRIELAHGRIRPYRNAPRTLDLDLLLYGTDAINEPELIVPHPRMHERAFVLKPLDDLAPGLQLKQGVVRELLAVCADQPVAAIAG